MQLRSPRWVCRVPREKRSKSGKASRTASSTDGGDVAIAPGIVAAPHGVARIKADVGKKHEARGDGVGADSGVESLPSENGNENGEDQQWIEEEDGFFRREEGAKEADVEWSLKWVGFGPVGMALQGFMGDNADVGVGEGAEAIELVEAIEEAEEAEDRDGRGGIGSATIPELRGWGLVEPENQQHKGDAGQQVEACGEAGEQVQSECGGSDEKRATGCRCGAIRYSKQKPVAVSRKM